MSTPPALRWTQARQYARNLRGAAVRFRGGEDTLRLTGDCGEWIIQAWTAGFFPQIPELAELECLIAYHTSSEPPDQPPAQATLIRCPSNLFVEVRGCHMVIARWGDGQWVEERHRGRIKQVGGLLPDLAPGHDLLSPSERSATTCEFLADLIEQEVATPTRQDQGKPEVPAPLKIMSGGFRLWGGPRQELIGKPLEVLRLLVAARGQCLTAEQLAEAIWPPESSSVTLPQQAVKDAATKLRKALAAACRDAGVKKPGDPLPSTGQGKDLAYSIDLPARPTPAE